MMRYQKPLALFLGLSIVCLSGCAAADQTSAVFTQAAQTAQVTQTAETVSTADAVKLTFSDTAVTGSGAGVETDGTYVSISKAGTYVLSGSCADGSVTVKKGTTGVTLVLDNLSLTATDRAAIACNKGSQVTIQVSGACALADGEQNNDETYPDNENAENAVIKCKDGSQVTLCGTGSLTVTANGKNGIKSGADSEDGKASLTIQELTLTVDAPINDAINAEALLDIPSGNLTVNAGDDAVHSDLTLNIGAEGTEGPTIDIQSCYEGLEGAYVNIYSGNISIQATDDCINAADPDLKDVSFTLTISGGKIDAYTSGGDGFDSNGDLTISGGTVSVWTANTADNQPLDADGTITISGGTVLAAGGSAGMGMNLQADQPCLVFGGSNGMGGRGGMGGSSLAAAGSAFTITDASGNPLYEGTAKCNTSFLFFSSDALSDGTTCTLTAGTTETTAEVQTGTVSSGMGGFGGGHGGMGRTDGDRKNSDGERPDFGGKTPPEGNPPDGKMGGNGQQPPDQK